MEKLMKAAKGLDTFFRVLFWILVVFGVLMTGGIIYMAVHGNTDMLSVDMGQVMVQLKQGIAIRYEPAGLMILALVQLGLGLTISFLGIGMLRSILQPMKEGQPFAHPVAKGLRKLALLTLVGGGVMAACQVIWQKIMLSAVDVYTLFDASKVSGITVNFRYDLTFLLVSMILELLSFVFRYGEELQRQSDETL